MRLSWGRLAPIGLAAATALSSCKPTSVVDAENKGDVGYLAANGSPEAVAALGRLADKNPKAKAAVEARAESDLNAYIAAWAAVQRGAPWGSEIIRAGLRQPLRADLTASAMARGDAKLAEFVPDLSGALVTIGTAEPRVTVAAILASANATAVVAERLKDKTTRANMCRGLGSADASAANRKVLLDATPDFRDDPACVDATVKLATVDDTSLAWLATTGEPGLLSGAGKGDTMPCPRLATLWAKVISTRPRETHGSLAVPLAHAIKRCPTQFDDTLSTALGSVPGALGLVVSGVDPFGPETKQLTKTCRSLGTMLPQATGRTKDRATDTLTNGCKGAPRK